MNRLPFMKLLPSKYFTQYWPDHPVKEGTVQGWEDRCNREVTTAMDHGSL